MELLNQMDGFDQTVNVKVIMATNRADTLDPALLRPGRLDRKIEFPLPDRRQKRLVFQVSSFVLLRCKPLRICHAERKIVHTSRFWAGKMFRTGLADRKERRRMGRSKGLKSI